MSDRESSIVTVQPSAQPQLKPTRLHRYIDSFKPIQEVEKSETKAYVRDDEEKLTGGTAGTAVVVDGDASVEETKLKRRLQGRHLQMIAIGGSIVSDILASTLTR